MVSGHRGRLGLRVRRLVATVKKFRNVFAMFRPPNTEEGRAKEKIKELKSARKKNVWVILLNLFISMGNNISVENC